MNSDTTPTKEMLNDTLAETGDLIKTIASIAFAGPTVLRPDEMKVLMEALKEACDIAVETRSEQWRMRGY